LNPVEELKKDLKMGVILFYFILAKYKGLEPPFTNKKMLTLYSITAKKKKTIEFKKKRMSLKKTNEF
jgi:hypothetical protein